MTVDAVLLHFAKERPVAVARELQKFPLRESWKFLAELPSPIAASVASQMPSLPLTQLLAEVAPAAEVASWLAEAAADDASALVAHIPGGNYEKIVDAGSEAQKSVLNDLFGLLRFTIASQTTSDFIRVTPNMSCGEVEEQLSQGDHEEDLPIFVVDEASRYLGMVPIFAVLAEDNQDSRIGKFMVEVNPVHAEASIHSVLSLREWYEHPCLPVIDDDDHLLGSVAASDLLRAAGVAHQAMEKPPVFQALDTFFDVCADALDFVLLEPKR